MDTIAPVLLHVVLTSQTLPLFVQIETIIFFLDVSNVASISLSSSSGTTSLVGVLLLHKIQSVGQVRLFSPNCKLLFCLQNSHQETFFRIHDSNF